MCVCVSKSKFEFGTVLKVAVLLGQTPALRQRLLQEPAEAGWTVEFLCGLSPGWRHASLDKGDDKAGRTYVHGNFTCTYEDYVIAARAFRSELITTIVRARRHACQRSGRTWILPRR